MAWQYSEKTTIEMLLDDALERLKSLREPSQQRAVVHDFATRLFEQMGSILRHTEQTLKQRFAEEDNLVENLTVWLNQAGYNDEQRYFYRQHIINTADRLSYIPNLSGYRAWQRLRIRVNGTMTDLIFSLHEVGQEPTGVMVISAFGTRKDSAEEMTIWGELQPICDAAFSFTYQDSPDLLASQLEQWLRKTIKLGLIYWQKGL